MKTYYITTPIYYPSEKFHIGHCYTTIIADSLARYKKLSGYDVFFQTGSDEHGEKIAKRAEEANKTPKDYVDVIIDDAKDLWKQLDIEYDYFIRTTDEDHVKRVQKIFELLYNNGDIYKGTYKGLYCVPCESFWTDKDLIEGKCPDCNREVEEVEEETYFFKLSKYQAFLEELYKREDFILPKSRRNELYNNFVKPGLEDISVTRTTSKWGIEVPFDKEHTIYVWIDALSNYITSLGYPDNLDLGFNKYWPVDLHLVGKEITRFHAIIWPALLKALDIEIPKQIFAHGWLLIEGGKISKSIGNYEDPRIYIEKFGVDAVRYYILKEVKLGSDGNFSVDALINLTNSDLVNTLGNLVTRTVSMIHKYFDGNLKYVLKEESLDKDLINNINNLYKEVDKKINNLQISEALEIVLDNLHKTNKYIDETTPWILGKDESNHDRLSTVLYNILESIRISSILLKAFVPNLSDEILSALNTDKTTFNDLSFGLLDKDLSLDEPKIIYKRIEKDE